MTAWVDIPPLEQRAADCRVCCRILDVLAHEATRLRRIKNTHRLEKLAGPEYSDRQIRYATHLLQNANLITGTTDAKEGKLRNPTLTDAGWDAATIARPFWMFDT